MLDGLLYAIGSRVCHQMPERAFFIGGNELFVSSRDTGVYLGFLLAILVIMALKEANNRRGNLLLISAFIVPIAIDGLGVFFGFWESDNVVRLNSGLFAGIGMAYLLAYAYPGKKADGLLPSLWGLVLSVAGEAFIYVAFFVLIPRYFDTQLAFEVVNFLVFAGLAAMLVSVGWLARITLNRKRA